MLLPAACALRDWRHTPLHGRFKLRPCSRSTPTPITCPATGPTWPTKYGDDRFPVIHHGDDGRHRIYKDGKFFREIWPKTWDPQERIDDYARFGVQVQVITTVPVMF